MPKRDKFYAIKDGKVYARVVYKGSDGKRHEVWRRAKSRTHAKELAEEIRGELAEHGEESVQATFNTFNQLADYYEKRYLVPAKFVEGRRVSGRRSLGPPKTYLKALRLYFGERRLRSITYEDLHEYKQVRFEVKVRPGSEYERERSIGAVQRELAFFRAVLNVAVRKKWIPENPFNRGDALITSADEKPRQRIITKDEEKALLDACMTPDKLGRDREYLRPILICALDTGMRRGEMLKMRWCDLDFDSGLITIQETHTKDNEERQVKMTVRLALELVALREKWDGKPETLVFGLKSHFNRSWKWVREKAKLKDVRLHDTRHSTATRLIRKGASISEVSRLLGHSDPKTTYRYVNPDIEAIEHAANLLDELNEEK